MLQAMIRLRFSTNSRELSAARLPPLRFGIQLEAFNQKLECPDEQVTALYHMDTQVLFFTPRNGKVPWPALSRELSTVHFPEEDPGALAASLREVLAAELIEEAGATLDELGFARLDTSVPGATAPSQIADILGTDAPMERVAMGEAGARTGDLGQFSSQEPPRDTSGDNATRPTPPSSPATSARNVEGVKATGNRAPDKKSAKERPVLRSYVAAPHDGAKPSINEFDVEGSDRSPVDEGGVSRVLEHEVRAGRIPTEMPHTNPGYDVEFRDSDGKILRYIEVKSFSGRWADTYAVLSRRQFSKAGELGDLFWLYVVEGALTEDFHIYRIQNPALNANHFMFDDGWSATAEAAPTSSKDK